MPEPATTEAKPVPVGRPEAPANVLAYAGHEPTTKKMWWGSSRPASRMALISIGVCVALALLDPVPLHLSHGTYQGPIATLAMLVAALSTLVYVWSRIGEEPNISTGCRLLLRGAALACGPLTVWLYAELNPLRDNWPLSWIWPGARWPLAGLAICVALFASGRIAVSQSRRTLPHGEPLVLPPP